MIRIALLLLVAASALTCGGCKNVNTEPVRVETQTTEALRVRQSSTNMPSY